MATQLGRRRERHAADAAVSAEKAFHDAVTVQHAAIAKGNALLRALKMLVTNQLGSSEGIFGDFGFTIPKRRAPDPDPDRIAISSSQLLSGTHDVDLVLDRLFWDAGENRQDAKDARIRRRKGRRGRRGVHREARR